MMINKLFCSVYSDQKENYDDTVYFFKKAGILPLVNLEKKMNVRNQEKNNNTEKRFPFIVTVHFSNIQFQGSGIK